MSDEEKRWPFDGFYLKLAEAQREYEQEQHIDPASLTEEERQQKLQEILDCINASRKKKKDTDEQLDPIVPEEEPETAGATPQPAKQYITDLVGEDYKNWHGIVVLDAGTNSGKTYFILKTLLPWAYEHRKRILILCNREALRNQIERDVNRLGSIEVSYEDYDPALGGIVDKTAIDNKYEHTIRVETYQWLETFLQRNEDAAKTYLRSFDYEGILVCQRENFTWDAGLRKRFRRLSIGVVVLLSGAVLIMGVILNESVIELLCRIAFWAPMLQWLFETVKMLNDDLENLNELDVAINSKEEKSMEDLQDIQKLIYEHRKGCLTIPNFFYGYFKDNDEDRAHRMANM